MFSSYDISASALVAQRARLDVISTNLANLSSTRDEAGEGPFQKRIITFAADEHKTTSAGGVGVKVTSVETVDTPPRMVHDPFHPDADPETGYVALPDIDMTTEFVNALEATRAYEANVGVMEITGDIGERTLQILV